MGSGGQAREDTLLGQEKGASANRENGSLSGGVSLLEIGKGRDQAKGLGFLCYTWGKGRLVSQLVRGKRMLTASIGWCEAYLRL